MSQTMANLVDVRGVSFSRANRLIFDDISLTVPRGKITAIMGPSGSGKSTLLSALIGALPTIGGERQVAGDVARQRFADDLQIFGGIVHHEDLGQGFDGGFTHAGAILIARPAPRVRP